MLKNDRLPRQARDKRTWKNAENKKRRFCAGISYQAQAFNFIRALDPYLLRGIYMQRL
jgi:hypothetical protein